MFVILVLLGVGLVCATDGIPSQTYNGYGKGYGGYMQPAKGAYRGYTQPAKGEYGDYTQPAKGAYRGYTQPSKGDYGGYTQPGKGGYGGYSGYKPRSVSYPDDDVAGYLFRPRSPPKFSYGGKSSATAMVAKARAAGKSSRRKVSGSGGPAPPFTGKYGTRGTSYGKAVAAHPAFADTYGELDFSRHRSLTGARARTYETPYDPTAPGRSSRRSSYYSPKLSASSLYFPKSSSSSSSSSYLPKSSPAASSTSYFSKSSPSSYFPKSSSSSYAPKSSLPSSYPDFGSNRYDRSHHRMRLSGKSLSILHDDTPDDSFKFYGKSDIRYRNRDPCVNMKEGEYVLDRRFHQLFSYVDPQCYFVKCANKKAYLNPCSTASRNSQSGEGFCNIIDLEGFCGPSFHEIHRKKKKANN